SPPDAIHHAAAHKQPTPPKTAAGVDKRNHRNPATATRAAAPWSRYSAGNNSLTTDARTPPTPNITPSVSDTEASHFACGLARVASHRISGTAGTYREFHDYRCSALVLQIDRN